MTAKRRRTGLVPAILFAAALSACATPPAPENLQAVAARNPLLMAVYRSNPDAAGKILGDIRSIEGQGTMPQLTMGTPNSAPAGNKPMPEGNYTPYSVPPLDLPNDLRGSYPSGDAAGRWQNDRRSIIENPLLGRLYNKSPLATLRMLQRMREASNQQ